MDSGPLGRPLLGARALGLNIRAALQSPQRRAAASLRFINLNRPAPYVGHLTENTMKKMIAALVLCIVSAAASVPAMAQALPGAGTADARVERMMAQVQERFASANTTHDGKLTRAQAQAGMPRVAQHFDEIDTQKAGFVTLAQIEDFMRERATAR
jgi:hypothetical protein